MHTKYQTETSEDSFPSQTALGARLRQLRKQRRISLIAFARQVGVSKPTVWKWERGDVRPRQKSIEAAASVLGVSERELVFGGEEREAIPNVVRPSAQQLSEVVNACKEQIAGLAGTGPENIAITIQI